MDDDLTFYCNCCQPSLFVSLGEDFFVLFMFYLRLICILGELLLVEEGIVVFEEGLKAIRHREA